MKIEPFGVEQWMNAWETRCALNLAETCVESLTVEKLLRIAGRTQAMPSDLAAMKLTYGAIPGSERLRAAVARLFARQGAENVLITHGTIGANHMVYQTLVEPGDHVVAITPTYQQHTAIPASIGAAVTELPLREAEGWLPDLDRLAELVTPETKLIALTNPNNPTGARIGAEGLSRIAEIADGAWVLCDEVYRGTEQDGRITPSVADLYEKGLSTGSTSKAFSLAGLRLGWIVGPEAFLKEAEIHRDYTTISVGMIDDYFAAMALENAEAIFARGREITGTNLDALGAMVDRTEGLDWVRPEAGTTALLRCDLDMPSYALCEQLIAETGVMLTPGSVMGMEGYLRIGFGNPSDEFAEGLGRLEEWFAMR